MAHRALIVALSSFVLVACGGSVEPTATSTASQQELGSSDEAPPPPLPPPPPCDGDRPRPPPPPPEPPGAGGICGACHLGHVCCSAPEPCAGFCVPDCRPAPERCPEGTTCGAEGVCLRD